MVEAINSISLAAWPDKPNLGGWGLTTVMSPLVESLLDKTRGLVLEPRFVRRAYSRSKPRGWNDVLKGSDGVTLLNEAIPDLGRAVQKEKGPPPLLDFVARLTTRAGEPWATDLNDWLDDAATTLGVDRALVTAGLDAEATEAVQVLVRIRTNADAPAQVAAGEWLVHAWSWRGTRIPETLFNAEGRRFKVGASQEIAYALIDELEDADGNPDLTHIAFIVPATLAWQPIHSWRPAVGALIDPPIGATYTVTVRPLERVQQVRMLRLRFKKAWDELKKNTAKMLAVLDSTKAMPAGGIHAVMLDASAVIDDDLRSILGTAEAPCVVLRKAPSAASIAQLNDVLNQTTAPVILWSQDTSPAGAEAAIRDLLQAGPIASIPRRIRDKRKDAFRDKTGQHPGAGLMLIWDNADYAPPEQEPDARARFETT
jgi:NTP-dependent ternary conflict system VMAP-like protein